MKRLNSVYLIICIFACGLITAQVPQTMSYQGLLTDNQGQKVSDGDYSLTFRIYNQETEGTALWQETQNVSIIDGVFDVTLGKLNPLSLSFDEKYWLSTAVSHNAEMPRIELTASPYSLNAKQVKGTNIFPETGYTGIGTANPESPLEVKDHLTISAGESEGGQLTLLDADNQGGWEIDNFGETDKEELRIFRDRGYNNQFSVLQINPLGNVGIGAYNPQEKLEVDGLISSTNGGFKFPDGSVQATAATDGTGTGGGDITSVIAGYGLTGGAMAGDATLNVVGGTGISVTDNAVALNTTYTDGRYVNEGQANSISTGMITPNVVSSIGGVSNDGGNIDLVAGSNVTITPDDGSNTITISASGSGTGGNTLDGAYDQGGAGIGRTINADAGPVNIAGPGGLTVNGALGVGTNSPEEALHVKGFMKLEGADFIMAEPSRGNGGRALVHWGTDNNDDELVMNFDGDFEKGVRVDGTSLSVGGFLVPNGGIQHPADLNTSSGQNYSVAAGNNINLHSVQNYSVTAGSNMSLNSGRDLNLIAGMNIIIEAADQMTIKCGKASIILKKNGDIEIKGNKINIKGSGDVVVKGSKIKQN